MADITHRQDVEEGQGDFKEENSESSSDEEKLSPLAHIQKCFNSDDVWTRQMVGRILLQVMRNSPATSVLSDLPTIMILVERLLTDEATLVKTDLIEQIPQMAMVCVESNIPEMAEAVSKYLLPFVVNCIKDNDAQVRKTSQATLLVLMEHNLISKEVIEAKVCPTILEISFYSTDEQIAGAVDLMSKMAPLLGKEATERIFLDRFAELCSFEPFLIRKNCASSIGDFCAIVGSEAYEHILLPKFVQLCADSVWTVRKCCAEVVMAVSCACPSHLRRTMLSPAFEKLLDDESSWVRIVAYQHLGPFISTFANPRITGLAYSQTGELIIINSKGTEFRPRSIPDSEGSVAITDEKQGLLSFNSFDRGSTNRITKSMGEFYNSYQDKDNQNQIIETEVEMEAPPVFEEIVQSPVFEVDIEETSVSEVDNETINDLAAENYNIKLTNNFDTNLNKTELQTNENIIDNLTLNNLNQNSNENAINKDIDYDINNSNQVNIKVGENNEIEATVGSEFEENKFTKDIQDLVRKNKNTSSSEVDTEDKLTNLDFNVVVKKKCRRKRSLRLPWKAASDTALPIDTEELTVMLDIFKINDTSSSSSVISPQSEENSTNNNSANSSHIDVPSLSTTNSDDDLEKYNSHQYWYISPELPLDFSIIDSCKNQSFCNVIENTSNKSVIEDDYLLKEVKLYTSNNYNVEEDKFSPKNLPPKIKQNIVPQLLIDHFTSMTNTFLINSTDADLCYQCAFSFPAVALTLGRNNWEILHKTYKDLANVIHWKVRRVVADSLHEVATILGEKLATEFLAPIFDDLIDDLDVVKIGILKHMAYFLKIIQPQRRNQFLPRLVEFLVVDNVLNWRYRCELANQLLLSMSLWSGRDVAKFIMPLAVELLQDKVAAVRKAAILLVSDLIHHVDSDSMNRCTTDLAHIFNAQFAHSTSWVRRQTFVLICAQLVTRYVLPPEIFARDLLPHFLDLSWDPVANVRLAVSKTIASDIIKNNYFADPNGPHYETIMMVLRRLQGDKDRDVRAAAIHLE